jgi:hypothetical protein
VITASWMVMGLSNDVSLIDRRLSFTDMMQLAWQTVLTK